MRVIAGEARGRRLKAPTAGTRPMADRIKEALFSSLGDVNGYSVLDLYAGSGALGLEALSRGAKRGVFVENAREAIVKLRQNIATCDFEDRCEVQWIDVPTFLSRPGLERFDLIFVDPPYATPTAAVVADLERIVTNGYLADAGRVVVHRQTKDYGLDPLGLRRLWERAYGQSTVIVFTHEDEA